MSAQKQRSQSDKLLQSLTKALKEYRYTGTTDEQKQQTAQNRYASAYDEKRLAAQQSYDVQDQALLQELEGLQSSYDRQRKDSAEQYRQAISQADRNALGKGMQRSSYQQATLSGMAVKGAEALQELNGQQSAQEQNIRRQRTQAAAQLAQSLNSYNLNEQRDVQSYVDELTEKEAKEKAASQEKYQSLLTQLYQYRTDREKEKQQQANWLAEFRAKYGK